MYWLNNLVLISLRFFSDLNLLDWSVNNHLAVALGGAVYLWNAGNGTISQLMESENPDEYISSVNWIKEGNILGIGKSNGSAQVSTGETRINDKMPQSRITMVF